MALPRIVTMTCLSKTLWQDGNVMLEFSPKTTLNEAKGTESGTPAGAGHYGFFKVLVSPTAAADFVVGTDYTWTAT